MAQAQRQEKLEEQQPPPQETIEMKLQVKTNTSCSSSSSDNGVSSFKFNAHAPEFVPRSHTQMPISSYYYPCLHYLGGSGIASGSSDLFFVGDQERAAACLISNNPNLSSKPQSSSKNVLTDDLRIKIVKQVEYQLSDMSLLANESLSKQISKDPEGYVPISFIASTKKTRSLINANQLLAQALRSSTKLVVSGDGKKVKRKHPFTEKDREEVQSRTVVVENLPEDHSHQNLDKIFNVVGSVKNIRICHPQDSNSSSSRTDFTKCNKLHALVELDSAENAEKAVEKLNDETNWRNGLKVRLLLGLTPKSVLKTRSSEFNGILDEDDSVNENSDDSSQPNNTESTLNNAEGSALGSKKGKAKGRGKGRGARIQSNKLANLSPQSSNVAVQCEAFAKQMSKGPRMPDGTKGFIMGRGKPLPSLVK